jgi:hypothetical protein
MTLINTSDLFMFCQYVIRKYGNPNNATEEQKAEEFRKVYFKDIPLNLHTLQVVASVCGIRTNSVESKKMPAKLRGYHEVIGDHKNIYYREEDSLSGIQNTILHEIREMMETLFCEDNPTYIPLKTSARHLAANQFATAVLLPLLSFTAKVYDTGLDIIELSSQYSKSCSQVLLRMGEVLQGKLFMYAALYEPNAENELRVTYWTACHNETDSDSNVFGADGLFPRKGKVIVSDSLVAISVQERKPCLAQRITLLDSMDEGLVAIARPLMISEIPVKVVLIVLLEQNRSALQPQIDRLQPMVIDGFHGHL